MSGIAIAAALVAALMGGACPCPSYAQTPSAQPGWIASWATSPQAGEADAEEPLANIDGQTVRQRVRMSIGGTQLRVRLSNELSASPLTIGSASIAVAKDASTVEPASLRQLTFGGQSSVSIPAGAPILSDPVDLQVAPGAQVGISLFFPGRVTSNTLHSLALKRAVVSTPGDHTRETSIAPAATSTSSIAISAVLVPQARAQRLLVAFGDSITDGAGSTTDADRSWPAQFAQRVAAADPGLSVVNAGIAGNQLSHEGYGASGLARFDRDVLALPGVTHIVLLEGINDIAAPGVKIGSRYFAPPTEVRTAEHVISAYRQLIARAHDHGIKVIGATLTPFAGNTVPGFYSPQKEAARQTVNAWIRNSHAFDAVIDFDAVLRDAEHPLQLQARFASRDRLHPNDAGYAAMADAIDVTLFR
ncbi:esterase [Xanthomonas campestris]|uniref:SGNH/GDSL hydrolase family protein n=1 Tax=Xanthomonas campestris TaxID=339 RepID=UPI000E771022|nr:SGNH/GDSL hydrolase family protein [Xanthomonas campestris]RJU09542.1 esterase [Xanthomonas campestris]